MAEKDYAKPQKEDLLVDVHPDFHLHPSWGGGHSHEHKGPHGHDSLEAYEQAAR